MSTNVNSKTLIANWVEEVRQSHGKLDWVVLVVNPPPSSLLTLLQRQCAHLEEGNRNKDGTLSTKLHREGHKVLEGVVRVHIRTSLYPCCTGSSQHRAGCSCRGWHDSEGVLPSSHST